MAWYDELKELTFEPYPCPRGCGTMVECGLMNAVEHWHDCVGEEGVREATKKAMKQLGWSNSTIKEAMKNLGI